MVKDKVIIIAQNFIPEAVGGASRIYEMARLLRQEFNDVNIVCPPPTYPFGKYRKAKYFFASENYDLFRVSRIWTFQPTKQTRSSFQRILYYSVFSILACFYLFVRSHRASFIIISVPPSSLLITTLVARLFRKKLIIDVRDLWVDAAVSLSYIKRDSIMANLVKKFEEYCWRNCDMLLTNSMIIHDILTKATNRHKVKIKYFPINIDLNVFHKLGVKPQKQIIYIGNFGVAQNLQALIAAAPQVFKAFPDVKIKLYGGGDCEADIKRQVRELGLEKYIGIHDPIRRECIPEILSESLLGIIPLADNDALRYAIPTKTFEYFASNLPVVAYGSSDELERVIIASKAGVYVRGNSPAEIANAIIDLMKDKARLEEYSTNGRRFVAGRNPTPSFLFDP